jgi:hypothetical protein
MKDLLEKMGKFGSKAVASMLARGVEAFEK